MSSKNETAGRRLRAARHASAREEVLQTAREVLRDDGLPALTHARVAQRLGVTKQAVLHYFRTKDELITELALGQIEAEAAVLVRAAEEAPSPHEALAAFVTASVRYHSENLDCFRIEYLYLQLQSPELAQRSRDFLVRVYPLTSRMYGALEARLRELPALAEGPRARQIAVTAHLASLGLVTMVGLSDVLEDPLKHATGDLTSMLAGLLTNGLAGTATASAGHERSRRKGRANGKARKRMPEKS